MTAVEKSIPLRCQDCHYFADTLAEIESLTAEADLIEDSRYELEKTFPAERIKFYLSTIAFRLVQLRVDITRSFIYSVGCPGVDLSQSIGTGEPVQLIQCQSPFRRPSSML